MDIELGQRLCDEWLSRFLRTGATDYERVSRSIKDLYTRNSFKEPKVVFAPSPAAAMALYRAALLLRDRDNVDFKDSGFYVMEPSKDGFIKALCYGADIPDIPKNYADIAKRNNQSALGRSWSLAAINTLPLPQMSILSMSSNILAFRNGSTPIDHKITDYAYSLPEKRKTENSENEENFDIPFHKDVFINYDDLQTALSSLLFTDSNVRSPAFELEKDTTPIPAREKFSEMFPDIGIPRESLSSFHMGNFDPYAEACLEYVATKNPEFLTAPDKYEAWKAVVKDTSIRYMGHGLVVVSEYPTRVRIDNERRLHSEDGATISWADGSAVYYWHGYRIPSQWILNKGGLTGTMALSIKNSELSRCACEILGWEEVLRDVPHTVIDKGATDEIGTLISVDIPNHGAVKFLRAKCPTGRWFMMPADLHSKRATEAKALMFGVPESIIAAQETQA